MTLANVLSLIFTFAEPVGHRIHLEILRRYRVESCGKKLMRLLDSLIIRSNSKRQFAKLVMRELKAAGDTRACRFAFDEFKLHFTHAGKRSGFANLNTLYDEYSQHRFSERKRFLGQAVRSLLAVHKRVPASFDDARHDILPSLRPRAFFSNAELLVNSTSDPEFSWPYLPLTDHLGVGLVYDLPETMTMIHQQQLDKWGVSFYEAYEIARANLMEHDTTIASLDDQLYVTDTQDNYDATRLALPDWISELDVNGDPIAMAVNRDKLLITGTDETRGLMQLAAIAENLLNGSRPLSGHAFRYQNHEWVPWLPNRGAPTFNAFNRMAMKTLKNENDEQQLLLERTMPRQNEFALVSAFQTRERISDEIVSCCVWAEGESCLLPKTQRIILRPIRIWPSAQREAIEVRWDDAMQILKDQIRDEGLYPPRFRTLGFPNHEQLEQLTRRQVKPSTV